MSTEPTQPEDLASLNRRAFDEYGTRALRNMRPVKAPTPADALAITQAFPAHGRMDGRPLVESIEALCRAHPQVPVGCAAAVGGAPEPRQLRRGRHRHQGEAALTAGGYWITWPPTQRSCKHTATIEKGGEQMQL